MSRLGEQTLMGLLVDVDSVQLLAKEGLDPEVIPTESLRPVVDWALTYYRTSNKAPTSAVMAERFGDLLTDHDVDLSAEVEESIEWAIDDLKSSFVRKEAGSFSRRLITDISGADPEERVATLGGFSAELASLSMRLAPRTTQVDLRTSGEDILADYQHAVATQGQVLGLGFGLPQVDQYMRGIHEGELCVVAGGPKTGKSWFLGHTALRDWQSGRATALFTLENSIKMTQMRIACMALNLSITEMQQGLLDEEDYERLRGWVHDVLLVADNPFLIFNPMSVQRSPQAIVQAARANGADSLIVDQLTFLENGQKGKNNQPRHYELRDIMHDLKALISTGRNQMPCMLAHQINREGVKAADKTGYLSMTHMAEASEIERTADWVWGLYASEDMRAVGRMQLQGLAARRMPTKSYDLLWQIGTGTIGVINEVEFD